MPPQVISNCKLITALSIDTKVEKPLELLSTVDCFHYLPWVFVVDPRQVEALLNTTPFPCVTLGFASPLFVTPYTVVQIFRHNFEPIMLGVCFFGLERKRRERGGGHYSVLLLKRILLRCFMTNFDPNSCANDECSYSNICQNDHRS